MVARGGLSIKMSPKFISDFQALSPDLRQQAMLCLEDFKRDPLPNSRRPHSVSTKGRRPVIFTMDVTLNKSHKLSYKIDGNTAFLLRVATHKTIDRDPGVVQAKAPDSEFV